MSAIGSNEAVELAKAHVPSAAVADTIMEKRLEKGIEDGVEVLALTPSEGGISDDDDLIAVSADVTEDDLKNLRRVPGKVPWQAFSLAFVELCERFSYYGTTVVFVNFIQRPLPPGSHTGAGFLGKSGALGMGQRASTGLITFNQFWAYLMPLLGAYIADAHLGRFKTIMFAVMFAVIGHSILTASAAPSVIAQPHTSIGVFSLGLIIFGLGTGLFKSNISPLLAEQAPETVMHVKVDKNGERVLVDPSLTTNRLFMYFYMCINIGSLTGQISMVYAEKYVGFWLSFMLPTILFLVCPVVLLSCKKTYKLTPPTGSVLSKAFRLFRHIGSVRGTKWEMGKPSNYTPSERPSWMTWDDQWVDEVRRGLKACKVFCFLPLYWLAYGQMTGNLTSQAATMQLNGVPNDLIQNLNPISIIIMVPLMDQFVYPALRRRHIRFTPIKRITLGFFFASVAMVSACVIQYYIYKLSPCGKYANSCDDGAPINVWIQVLPYIFIGISEIFTSITCLEYAFSKAPRNMKSLVMSCNLVMNAFSSAIAQALVSLSDDPYLIILYGLVAGLAFAGGVAFWACFRGLDKQEDKLNMLKASRMSGKTNKDLNA